MPFLRGRVSGTWTNITTPKVRVGGIWTNVATVWARISGAWRKHARPTAHTTTLAGSETNPTYAYDNSYDSFGAWTRANGTQLIGGILRNVTRTHTTDFTTFSSDTATYTSKTIQIKIGTMSCTGNSGTSGYIALLLETAGGSTFGTTLYRWNANGTTSGSGTLSGGVVSYSTGLANINPSNIKVRLIELAFGSGDTGGSGLETQCSSEIYNIQLESAL